MSDCFQTGNTALRLEAQCRTRTGDPLLTMDGPPVHARAPESVPRGPSLNINRVRDLLRRTRRDRPGQPHGRNRDGKAAA
jgi:hypothetical protein